MRAPVPQHVVLQNMMAIRSKDAGQGIQKLARTADLHGVMDRQRAPGARCRGVRTSGIGGAGWPLIVAS